MNHKLWPPYLQGQKHKDIWDKNVSIL